MRNLALGRQDFHKMHPFRRCALPYRTGGDQTQRRRRAGRGRVAKAGNLPVNHRLDSLHASREQK